MQSFVKVQGRFFGKTLRTIFALFERIGSLLKLDRTVYIQSLKQTLKILTPE
jgi:hypothetical protein